MKIPRLWNFFMTKEKMDHATKQLSQAWASQNLPINGFNCPTNDSVLKEGKTISVLNQTENWHCF